MSAALATTPATTAEQPGKTVLISGASFAGLASAWWMHRLGYRVTVVEVAPALRKGGTPVDIRESVVDVVRRMGLLDRIQAASLPPRPTEFLDPRGSPIKSGWGGHAASDAERTEWEIERDTLLDLLFHEVEPHTEFLFADSIASITEISDQVSVTFTSGTQRAFSLLLGCDGTHSAVRKLCFGDEAGFLRFLHNYFSLTIVDKLLLTENTSQMFNVPGKTIMLNSYNGKTDIAFCFFSPAELPYDRRDREQQRQLILDHFRGEGWRAPELLHEIEHASNFYFDKLCQIRMPHWTRGRVALVGDAGYCPSPAAGMGGSMAILGAAALGDALAKHPDDLRQAFLEYDTSLRPIVEEIQNNAVEFGLRMFAPTTASELEERNAQLLAS